MLIKFFPNGKGGGAGPVDYLTARTVLAYDENRDLIRDESGQPQQVARDPLPEILRGEFAIPFYFGGTSVLIVVSVTMDTIQQVQSHLLAHQYGDLIKKAKLKGRIR